MPALLVHRHVGLGGDGEYLDAFFRCGGSRLKCPIDAFHRICFDGELVSNCKPAGWQRLPDGPKILEISVPRALALTQATVRPKPTYVVAEVRPRMWPHRSVKS